jgi:hypothetical protein
MKELLIGFAAGMAVVFFTNHQPAQQSQSYITLGKAIVIPVTEGDETRLYVDTVPGGKVEVVRIRGRLIGDATEQYKHLDKLGEIISGSK